MGPSSQTSNDMSVRIPAKQSISKKSDHSPEFGTKVNQSNSTSTLPPVDGHRSLNRTTMNEIEENF